MQKVGTQKLQTIERDVDDLKKKYESLEATIETLNDKDVMEQIEKSLEDIKAGRTRNIDEFIKELEKEHQ